LEQYLRNVDQVYTVNYNVTNTRSQVITKKNKNVIKNENEPLDFDEIE